MELCKLLGTIAVDTSKADKAIEGTANKADKAGSKTSTAFEKMIEQMERLPDYLKASMPKGVVLDTGVMVGELTPSIDARLSDRLSNVQRGNVR